VSRQKGRQARCCHPAPPQLPPAQSLSHTSHIANLSACCTVDAARKPSAAVGCCCWTSTHDHCQQYIIDEPVCCQSGRQARCRRPVPPQLPPAQSPLHIHLAHSELMLPTSPALPSTNAAGPPHIINASSLPHEPHVEPTCVLPKW
jgi:hypothetical protein